MGQTGNKATRWGGRRGQTARALQGGSSCLVGTREPEILFREVTGLDLGARQITLATPLEVGQGGTVEAGGWRPGGRWGSTGRQSQAWGRTSTLPPVSCVTLGKCP